MSDKKDWFSEVNKKLSLWLEEVKHHELLDIQSFIEQAKEQLSHAEHVSEAKIQQFSDNLQQDLSEFYQQTKAEAKHSVYLGILSEAWWQTLADMSDKSQIEWAELQDDIKNSGEYKTGDVIGFGILCCQQCDTKIHMTHFSQVSDCMNCGYHRFNRLLLEP